MSKQATFQMSKAGMLAVIQKLRLEKGDILLVETPQAMEALTKSRIKLDFNVPLVFAPRGGIKVLKREDLLNLLEQLDQTENQTAGMPEETHAPL